MPHSAPSTIDSVETAAKARVGKPRKVPRVVILGGGTVGMYTARRLRKRLGAARPRSSSSTPART